MQCQKKTLKQGITHTYVCMWVWACMCIYTSVYVWCMCKQVHMEASIWHWVSYSVAQPLILLKPSLSLNLELINSARLAGRWAPRIYLSPHPKHWGYMQSTLPSYHMETRNQAPRVFAAGTLLTEPFPGPHMILFYYWILGNCLNETSS